MPPASENAATGIRATPDTAAVTRSTADAVKALTGVEELNAPDTLTDPDRAEPGDGRTAESCEGPAPTEPVTTATGTRELADTDPDVRTTPATELVGTLRDPVRTPDSPTEAPTAREGTPRRANRPAGEAVGRLAEGTGRSPDTSPVSTTDPETEPEGTSV